MVHTSSLLLTIIIVLGYGEINDTQLPYELYR